MSLQQVNLYLPELRPKKEWLTLSTLVISVVGVLIIYLLSFLFQQHNLNKLQQQVVGLENQLEYAREQVDSIRARAKPLQGSNLKLQITYLRAALEGREQVGQIIEGQNLGNAEGFTRPMQSLARHATRTIALENIHLSQGGQFLELSGQTRKTEDVASYLQALQDDPVFNNTRFGLLSIANTETPKGVHKFTMGFESIYEMTAKERER